MVLMNRSWNADIGAYQNAWLANDESDIPADFNADGAPGSAIFVISSAATYIKNADNKWQKVGTTEVIG